MVDSCGDKRTFYDVFLSHASADKPWVRTLDDALQAAGVKVFLDERDLRHRTLRAELSDALRASRFLVLVASPRGDQRWVEQEWTAFMAKHGPGGRIVVVRLERSSCRRCSRRYSTSTHRRDAARAAAVVRGSAAAASCRRRRPGRAFGQDLTFVLDGARTGSWSRRPNRPDPAVARPGRRHSFGVAWLGFQQLPRELADDRRTRGTGRPCRTLGEQLFALLFGDEPSRQLLEAAQVPGRPRPLVTIRSASDLLLALPWELLYDGGRSWSATPAWTWSARPWTTPAGPRCCPSRTATSSCASTSRPRKAADWTTKPKATG